jgi:hypothetical protein
MKEQEDRIMRVIKQQQEFHTLLNKIVNLELARGEYTAHVDNRTFTIYTGVGHALIDVDNIPDKNVILVGQNDITVNATGIEGKVIHYHLRHAKVSPEISLDILSYFVKPI